MPLVATFLVGGLIIAGAMMQSSSEATTAPTLVAVEPAMTDAPDTRDVATPPPLVSANTPRATPAAPARTAVTRGRPMVASQWVNMREEPSRSAEVLLVVPPQALVQADSSAPGWRRVAYDGAVGWVAEQHLVRQNQR